MKIYSEISLENFEAWSGGRDTLDVLIEKDLCDQLEAIIDDIEPEEGWSDTEINDLLWFERDSIADWLGFSDWEALEYGGEEEEEDEDEEENAFSAFCDSFVACKNCPYRECKTMDECRQVFKADHEE